MEFPNRTTQPQTAAPGTVGAASKRSKGDRSNWTKIVSLVFVAALAVVVLALLVLVTFGNNNVDKESTYVDTTKLQAVFLNSGQVYFGNIKTANSKYFVVKNIYYLQTASTGTGTNASTSVSLVKLGCELHEPFDQMIINRDQVTFWENLQDDGQVAKAVKTFEQQNPNGQKCTEQTQTSTSTTNSVQNAGNSSNKQ